MKKSLFTLFFTFCALSFYAQAPRWGVKGGMNFSNYGMDANLDAAVGFHVGGVAEWKFSEVLSVQSELNFTKKGAKNWEAYYLELPIYAKFSYQLGRDYIFLGVGPYLGYGLAGKIDYKMMDMDTFGDNTVKRMDFGLGVSVGYELESNLFVQLGYTYGLMNVSDMVMGNDMNNMNATFSVGYKF